MRTPQLISRTPFAFPITVFVCFLTPEIRTPHKSAHAFQANGVWVSGAIWWLGERFHSVALHYGEVVLYIWWLGERFHSVALRYGEWCYTYYGG